MVPGTFRLLPDWTPRDIRKLLSDSSIEAAAIADNVWVAMPHLPRFTVLQNKSKGVSFNLSDAPALQVRFVYPLHNFCPDSCFYSLLSLCYATTSVKIMLLDLTIAL